VTTRRHLAAATLGIHLIAIWAAVAAAAQPDPSASAGPAASLASASLDAGVAPELWLRGPFGRVAGGSLAEPSTAAPQDRPLDAYARDVPLQLEADDPISLAGLEVVARPMDAAETEQVLARGVPAFTGPSSSGQHLVIASAPDASAGPMARAWLIEVPDRDPPQDGVYDLPAPAITVVGARGEVSGSLGDGCYVYLCVETGRSTPPRRLEPLRAAVGESMELRIGDGSGLVAWDGQLTPLGQTRGPRRDARGAITDTPTATVTLNGLEPPGPGEWLLEVEVVLDRERGWLRTAYRLVVD
jgi:hypothetical protein